MITIITTGAALTLRTIPGTISSTGSPLPLPRNPLNPSVTLLAVLQELEHSRQAPGQMPGLDVSGSLPANSLRLRMLPGCGCGRCSVAVTLSAERVPGCG